MPTYEYRCKDCGQATEAVQAFTDAPLTQCPSCAGALRKVFGSVGISFKGSGFYKTDSRVTANGKKKSDEGSSDSKSSDTKTESKGDSTGDSKGDSKKAESSNGSGSSKKSDTSPSKAKSA